MRDKEQHLADLGILVGIDEFIFTKEEIDKVDDFFRQCPEKFQEKEHGYSEFERYFYAYIGIAYVTKYGGEWEFSDTKGDSSFGTPAILNDANYYRMAPSDWIPIIKKNKATRLSSFYVLEKLIPYEEDE